MPLEFWEQQGQQSRLRCFLPPCSAPTDEEKINDSQEYVVPIQATESDEEELSQLEDDCLQTTRDGASRHG